MPWRLVKQNFIPTYSNSVVWSIDWECVFVYQCVPVCLQKRMYFPIISMLCSLAPSVLPVIYIQGCLSVGRHQARGTASVSGNFRGKFNVVSNPQNYDHSSAPPQKHLLLDLFCSDLKGKTCCKLCKSIFGGKGKEDLGIWIYNFVDWTLTLTSCRRWGHRVLTGTHSAGSLRWKWLALLLADTELEKHLVPLFLFFCLVILIFE